VEICDVCSHQPPGLLNSLSQFQCSGWAFLIHYHEDILAGFPKDEEWETFIDDDILADEPPLKWCLLVYFAQKKK
jgi:hypothetical protein